MRYPYPRNLGSLLLPHFSSIMQTQMSRISTFLITGGPNMYGTAAPTSITSISVHVRSSLVSWWRCPSVLHQELSSNRNPAACRVLYRRERLRSREHAPPGETFDFDLVMDDRRGARRGAMTIVVLLLNGMQGLSFPHISGLGGQGDQATARPGAARRELDSMRGATTSVRPPT